MNSKIKHLPKDEKIAILQKIAKGEMKVKQGIFLTTGGGMVVISNNGKFYTDNSLEIELPVDVLEDYTGNLVVLPHNQR